MRLINRLIAFFLPNHKSMDTFSSFNTQIEAVASTKASTRSLWPETNANLYSQLEDKYYQYFIGVNSLLELRLNPFEVQVIKVLEETLQLEHSLAEEIHRLPDIIPKLIHLLKTDDFVWKDVANLIATDPVILVEIIKVAKSPLYHLEVKDEQLENILAQIGLFEVREIIMKLAFKPIMLFEAGYFLKHSGTKIWDHAVKSAVACRTLAEIYNQELFDAYLTGLLSNLGMAIIVTKMNRIKDFKTAPRSLLFKNELLNFSKQLSVKIAENWDMSPSIILALTEQRHFEEKTDANSKAKKMISPLGTILYEATAVSMKYILVSENRWLIKDQIDNEVADIAFDEAYQAVQDSVVK